MVTLRLWKAAWRDCERAVRGGVRRERQEVLQAAQPAGVSVAWTLWIFVFAYWIYSSLPKQQTHRRTAGSSDVDLSNDDMLVAENYSMCWAMRNTAQFWAMRNTTQQCRVSHTAPTPCARCCDWRQWPCSTRCSRSAITPLTAWLPLTGNAHHALGGTEYLFDRNLLEKCNPGAFIANGARQGRRRARTGHRPHQGQRRCRGHTPGD